MTRIVDRLKTIYHAGKRWYWDGQCMDVFIVTRKWGGDDRLGW